MGRRRPLGGRSKREGKGFKKSQKKGGTNVPLEEI